MAAKKYDLKIRKGDTFSRVIRWETAPLVWVPITMIMQVAPVEITAAGHGMPDGWRVAVTDVEGMHQINSEHNPPRAGDFHRGTVAGPDTITINDISAASFDGYTGGGYIVYYTPVTLTGYTARMNIRDRVDGNLLAQLDTANGNIVIDEAGFTILLLIAAGDTEDFTWMKAVYDLEMVSPEGVVTAILTGAVVITQEVTTTA